jgi:methylated-DNA-[protein]-cysteine S-methyltransferase
MSPAHDSLFTRIESPIGPLLLLGDEEALTGLYMDTAHAPPVDPGWRRADQPFADAGEQLRQYFAGERRSFDLRLRPSGTDFQLRAWEELRRIPYGSTCSYGEQARRIGRPTAARAVGAANGRNPISIIVPCHRVIASDGALTGFGGGLERKRRLLAHEAAVLASSTRSTAVPSARPSQAAR